MILVTRLSGQGQNFAAAPQYDNFGASSQNRGGGSNGILPFSYIYLDILILLM